MPPAERYALLAEMARGKYEMKGSDGFNEKVYITKPDISALKLLIEQADGKAAQSVDVKTDKDGTHVTIMYNGQPVNQEDPEEEETGEAQDAKS
jgi:hypothetical protein